MISRQKGYNNVKKTKLLLLLFTCGLLAACGKKEKTDVSSPETNYVGEAKEQPSFAYEEGLEDDAEMVTVPGVLIEYGQTDYLTSYSEQADGSLLFFIEGNWNENQKWNVVASDNPTADVKEVSRTNEKIEYQFTGQKEVSGYSEYTISLSDAETDKTMFIAVFSMLANQDGTLTALNTVGYIPSDEEEIEVETVQESTAAEETVEYFSPDELQYIAEQEREYAALMGERSYPEEFIITGKGTMDILETNAATIYFNYKGYYMNCGIAPSLTIDDLKQAVDDSETWKSKKVGETEVVYYADNTDTTMMWMDEANCCYLLSGREIPDSVYEEAIQLMLGN